MGNSESKPQSKSPSKSADEELLPKPWRSPPLWTEEVRQSLKKIAENHKPPAALGITQSRLLMIGPIGVGKSSFFNTINSIFRGRIAHQAVAANRPHTVTMKYRQHQVLNSNSEPMKFRLCDTCGLEENGGPDLADLNYILEGNVQDEYEFNPNVRITSNSSGFVKEPKLHQKIHCVVFVFDANCIGLIPGKVLETIKKLQERMNTLGIPSVLLVTKIDKLSEAVNNDVTKVFESNKIKNVVSVAETVLGIPRGNTMPIKNYENENNLDNNIDILALQALNRILGYAEDFLIRQQDINTQ